MTSAMQQDRKLTPINLWPFYTPIVNLQKKRLKEQSHLPSHQKKLRYLGINLTKEVKDLYAKNYTTLKKEIEEDVNRWKNIHVHGLVESTSSKCPYFLKQSIGSMHSPLKYQRHISLTQRKLSKSSFGTTKDTKQPQQS